MKSFESSKKFLLTAEFSRLGNTSLITLTALSNEATTVRILNVKEKKDKISIKKKKERKKRRKLKRKV